MPEDNGDPTTTLSGAVDGDKLAAADLFELVYDELRVVASRALRRERPDHTLQPTALVHELYERMIDHDRVDWRGKDHFVAVAARAMRRVLIDHARKKKSLKRGGDARKLPLDGAMGVSFDKLDELDLLALDEALEKLAALDERQSRLVELRFFGGLSVAEAARIMGVSKRTADVDWSMARAWLHRELAEDLPDEDDES